jgi:hypothetical protein
MNNNKKKKEPGIDRGKTFLTSEECVPRRMFREDRRTTGNEYESYRSDRGRMLREGEMKLIENRI